MNDAREGGNSPYQGRHSASESGAEYTPGPTSPVSGRAGEAAARAAYSDAPKRQQPEPVQEPEAATPDTPERSEQADPAAESQGEPTLDDSPEALAAAFELETSAREEELLNEVATLRAEIFNRQQSFDKYQERVIRDRDVEKNRAVEGVIEALLPVLDEIHLARQHGDLVDGPFARIAEKLEGILGRYGVERYGAEGEPFDPMVHQAITHTETDLPAGVTVTTVIQVMQPGYRMGEKVVRPAFVAVADPR
ncbi:MAG: nucleotide exchange factor GrpE [Dermatophilus congolensis]|nr:nucleotide exchange factor GrpE [Dermatophilus congolensis]